MPVRLDVTSRADAEAAVEAAVDRFGRIDVVHGLRADRLAVSTTGAGAHRRLDRDLRTWCPYGLAHPSALATLIVTTGCRRVQRDVGAIEDIHAGDIIWFEPGEKHWHGASPTSAMTHIVIS